MNQRLFIAIEIPLEIREKIYEKISSKIKTQNAKIVPKENIHITLKFLGQTQEEKIKELKEKLKEIENFKEFFVEFSAIGEFDRRVVWIGIKNTKKIEKIVNKINELLETKKEKIHAHTTIARIKKTKNIIKELNKEKIKEKFKVKEIVLMKSDLSGKKPIYSKIHSFKLNSFETL